MQRYGNGHFKSQQRYRSRRFRREARHPQSTLQRKRHRDDARAVQDSQRTVQARVDAQRAPLASSLM